MGLTEQPIIIPDKTYFKIGEVCKLTGLKSHTLRYWESEFSVIKPQRAGSQQRLYRRVDVENILRIKQLVHEDGLTLSGTKKLLAKERKVDKKTFSQPKKGVNNLIDLIKNELIEIQKLLK